MEEWRPIPSFPKYEASDGGNIRNRKTKKPIAPQVEPDGSVYVSIRDNDYHRKPIKRLVAETWLTKPAEKDFVIILNNDKANLQADNLQWADHAEKHAHIQAHKVICITKGKSRPIWRCDRVTEERLQMYDSVKMAAAAMRGNTVQSTNDITDHLDDAYGWAWRYNDADLEGETWVPIPTELIGKPEYMLSTMGRCKAPNRRIIEGSFDNRGYKVFRLGDVSTTAHRLIGQVLLKNQFFADCVINHIDGDKSNSVVDNLECVTQSANASHANATGLIKTRRKCPVVQVNYRGEIVGNYESYAEAFEKSEAKPGSIHGSVNSGPGRSGRYSDNRKAPSHGHVWFGTESEAQQFIDANPDYFLDFFRVLKTTLDGVVLADYKQYADAEHDTSIKGICRACTKGYQTGGFRWFRNTRSLEAFRNRSTTA